MLGGASAAASQPADPAAWEPAEEEGPGRPPWELLDGPWVVQVEWEALQRVQRSWRRFGAFIKRFVFKKRCWSALGALLNEHKKIREAINHEIELDLARRHGSSQQRAADEGVHSTAPANATRAPTASSSGR